MKLLYKLLISRFALIYFPSFIRTYADKYAHFFIYIKKAISLKVAMAVAIVVFCNTAFAQVKVSGTVRDSTGETLVGVTVKLKNSAIGTITDVQGKFSITTTRQSNTLVFSYIGYLSKEVVATSANALNIVLQSSANQLNQVNVVSIGYGQQKKAYVTGAVASANLNILRDAPNTNIAQALQGNIAGLNVGPVTSAGATPSIQLRGLNTINGNTNILIILDGVQYNNSLSSINPDDIASIEVLKDASSTAVYGAQAANGVLIITSRKPAANSKTRINFSTSYAISTPSGNIRPLDRQGYLDKIRNLYWDQAYLAPTYTQPNPAFNIVNVVDPTMRNGNTLSPLDYNWYGAVTKRGFINDNQLNISGASEKTSYLISGGYTNQAGYIINDLFKRKSLRVNVETLATDWLKVGVQSFGSFVDQSGAQPSFSQAFIMSPLTGPYNADGSLNPYPFNTIDANPLISSDVQDYDHVNYLFANLYSEISVPFIKGLTYRFNFGNTGQQSLHYNASQYGGGLTGSAYKNSENYHDYLADNILTYSKSYKKHTFLATAVYGAIGRYDESTSATGTGFTNIALGYNNLSLATIQKTYSGGYQETLNYYMGRLNYTYDGKYLLTGTLRRDGYSAFAANNKWGTFPSVSAGWIASEEGFIKNNIPVINYLKFRAGYGISGNQAQRYSSLDVLSSQPAYVFGDNGTTSYGVGLSSLANPNLKWERMTEVNIGVDFAVLNNRLTGTVDLYNRNTNDLLFPVAIPNITGFSSINSNVGQVNNKGIEVSLTSRNLRMRDFNWITTFNFSRNINTITQLPGAKDLTASGLFIGSPISAIYDYKTNGIYQLGDNIPAGYSPGTYRVVDYNGDGVVNANDRYVLGSTDPAYRFSVLNNFQYQDFGLSFLLNSIQGGVNGYLGSNAPSIARNDSNVRYGGLNDIQYWTPSNPNSPYANFIVNPTINPNVYYSRSFVRLQDVTLSYKLSNGLLRRLKVADVRFFASGKNLITWTKWKGWDPETGYGLTNNARPLLISYSFGTNVTF